MDKQFILPIYQNLEKEYADSVKCNRCGFCLTVCPTYMVTGKETLSPRGRNQAFRQILEGKILNPEKASEVFSTCLTCHACTNVCFSQVPVGKLMAPAKAVAQQEKIQWILSLKRKTLRFLLRHRSLLTLFLWPIFLLKRIGVSGLLNSIGILKLFSPELSRAEKIVAEAPLNFSVKLSPIKGKEELNYFSGCGTHYLYPAIGQRCCKVLEKVDFSVSKKPHPCCGLMANSAADVEGAKQLARDTIRFYSGNNDPIFIDDDSCYGFMKGYGELLGGEAAILFSKRVKNLAQIVSQKKFKKKNNDTSKVVVTCHDSCQIGNAYRETDPIRKFLENQEWVEFKEMEESTWCCGGAGAYCLKHPELSEEILFRKLKNIKATKAEVVIAGASSCTLQIKNGLRNRNQSSPIRVLHLGEFIEEFAADALSDLDKPLP